ncbi:unnamed protein product [Merluccius merluccius]
MTKLLYYSVFQTYTPPPPPHGAPYKRFRRRTCRRHGGGEDGPAGTEYTEYTGTGSATGRRCAPACREVDAVRRRLAFPAPTEPTRDVTNQSLRDSNLLACSCTGLIALALGSDVHLWNSETQSLEGHTHPGPDSPTHTQPGRACWPRRAVSSLCWSSDGRVLSIGTRQGQIQLWDVETARAVGCLWSHLSVVSALSWKQNILSSGSVLGHIHHHDPRAPKPLVGAAVQQGSVCSLQWSPGEDRLASGSKDGRLSIWEGDFAACKLAKLQRQPLVTMKQPSAVKAMGWCPWQRHVIATGGGWRDGELRIWDTQTASCVNSYPTSSQICSLLWVEERRVLVCGHGLPHHNISCWAAEHPDSLGKSHRLEGHTDRVLHLALSPGSASRLFSAGADDCVHVWTL